MSEKIQKVLARIGIGSRRGIEEIISQGRVSVNGAAAKLGDRIEDDVTVAVDGKVVLRPGQSRPLCRVLMYHKPEGELTTMDDPDGRPTVFDHLPNPGSGRWIYIGRLDINTSGLLLFTTDGELANALMHPSRGVERVYAARVFGEVPEEKLEKLTQGVKLEDGMAKFEQVEFAGGSGMNAWYRCTLREGRKREVRRIWEACGLQVSRLIRIKYAGISLDPELKAGQWRELSPGEINILRRSASLKDLDPSLVAPPLQAPGQGKGALGRSARERGSIARGSGGDRRRDSRERNAGRDGRDRSFQGRGHDGDRRGFDGSRRDGGRWEGRRPFPRGQFRTERGFDDEREGGLGFGDRRGYRSDGPRDGTPRRDGSGRSLFQRGEGRGSYGRQRRDRFDDGRDASFERGYRQGRGDYPRGDHLQDRSD
ncbi:MAG: 23S rRNA pseudouridine(2605) synthase RluB, partial [Succinivibrio sp.]